MKYENKKNLSFKDEDELFRYFLFLTEPLLFEYEVLPVLKKIHKNRPSGLSTEQLFYYYEIAFYHELEKEMGIYSQTVHHLVEQCLSNFSKQPTSYLHSFIKMIDTVTLDMGLPSLMTRTYFLTNKDLPRIEELKMSLEYYVSKHLQQFTITGVDTVLTPKKQYAFLTVEERFVEYFMNVYLECVELFMNAANDENSSEDELEQDYFETIVENIDGILKEKYKDTDEQADLETELIELIFMGIQNMTEDRIQRANG